MSYGIISHFSIFIFERFAVACRDFLKNKKTRFGKASKNGLSKKN